MTGSRIDNERLAALVDGRLSPDERAQVLAQLAESDRDTLAAFADAAAMVAPEEAPAGAVTSFGIARGAQGRRGLRYAAGLALAAGIVAVVVVPLAVRRGRRLDYRTDFGAILTAERLPPLPPAIGPTRGAGAVLGAGALDSVQSMAIAARVGALLTDLRLGPRAGFRRQDVAAELAERLRNAGQLGAGSLFDAIARAPDGSAAASDSAVAAAVRAVAPFGAPGMLTLGAWLEAARFAAATSDTAFFNRTLHGAALLDTRLARRDSAVSPQRLRALVESRSWQELSSRLDALQRELSR